MSDLVSMKLINRPLLLLILAGLCVAAGVTIWLVQVWVAVTELDKVTPESDLGRSMMGWTVLGTLIMIAGMILLHFAADLAETSIRSQDKNRRPTVIRSQDKIRRPS